MEQDLERWKRFKHGDPAAFEDMIRGEFRALFEYGSRFIHDRDALNDCIHDLFASLWDRRRFLADTDRIRPYLIKSLRNRLLKEIERRHALTTFETWHENANAEEDTETRLISSESEARRKQRIGTVLHTLTPRQREIIHLKFFEDLSHEQIAEVLEISRPAVANLLSQALRLFRAKWQTILPSFLFALLY
ncbi:DNA-directed RNA polymerase sigma-70 factor [Dyadobacter beijingensis]|uniref:DNA-directed RNA polymerase sigma-70 factor n=1 Tax=Dyadobacter beijingensis TaxID=365489 RepID=A0ABQ2HWW3_9BACT|nr:sigma-70 family RNA polymerase sigma factor [Dyadobacter beijingensis]GGM94052.1 DNA-directed RNA polymerase sigma-70 factor [Dyadobacter beijingensis]